MIEKFIFPKRMGNKHLQLFAAYILRINELVDPHLQKTGISSRGWAYQLEQAHVITKSEMDKVQGVVNKCRKRGFLPIDFVAEDKGEREFQGVEPHADTSSPATYVRGWIESTLRAGNTYQPDWWDGETYYVQMVAEKIDIANLFYPICHEYHIPIASSKGWSSLLQRAVYARRFNEAEKDGLKCILLYCGDHDPDGLRISRFLRKNLYDLARVEWVDGFGGYDPSNLIIDRFGLNYEFIEANKLMWINNLVTGREEPPNDLSDPQHPNHNMPYVQEYLAEFGARKCEANALIVRPNEARELCTSAIEHHLGSGARNRFRKRRRQIQRRFDEFFSETGLGESLQNTLDQIEKEEYNRGEGE